MNDNETSSLTFCSCPWELLFSDHSKYRFHFHSFMNIGHLFVISHLLLINVVLFKMRPNQIQIESQITSLKYYPQ